MGMHHRKIKKVIIVVALIIIQCVEHQTIIAQVLNHQKLLHPQPLSQWVTPNREKDKQQQRQCSSEFEKIEEYSYVRCILRRFK
mgnify:CR=1 FL=1